MMDLLQIGAFLVGSFFAAYILTYILSRRKGTGASPLAPGALVRLKTSDGVFRTRFVEAAGGRLMFAAPLKGDACIPIPAGEKITVESPNKEGVVRFRSTVTSRNPESHQIALAMPETVHRENRRAMSRRMGGGKEMQVEDRPAWLDDLSEIGLRFTRNGAIASGERIKVEMPASESVYAWVLECTNAFGEKGSHQIRARFEESVPVERWG